MRIRILGSGGAITIPRPAHTCRVCDEAREKGLPYTRSGPGLFLDDERTLFDTSEDIGMQINRERVERIDHAFYTHWHPDHTNGRRIFEQTNMDFCASADKISKTTNVYLPSWVRDDFEKHHGLMENFRYLEKLGIVALKHIDGGKPVKIGSTSITAYPMAQDGLTAYLLSNGAHTAPCLL